MNNIANIITITGLVIVVGSLYLYYKTSNILFIITSLIGFSCDYLDGYIARKFNISSGIGNILDKLVDKINQISILLLLIFKFNISSVFLIIYIIREIIMYMMRKYNLKSISSSFYGKLKTALFPLLLILFHFNINIKYIYLVLLTIFNLLTLII